MTFPIWPRINEKKWSQILLEERLGFAHEAKNMALNDGNIPYRTITVYKPNVKTKIRNDSNALYNYMVSILLLDRICLYSEAHQKKKIRMN